MTVKIIKGEMPNTLKSAVLIKLLKYGGTRVCKLDITQEIKRGDYVIIGTPSGCEVGKVVSDRIYGKNIDEFVGKLTGEVIYCELLEVISDEINYITRRCKGILD